MITVNEAFKILRDNLPTPRQETVDLGKAYSRYLAQDILAPEPSPRYTNSAMDGYALRWDDVQKCSAESPVSLGIVGESQAGVPYDQFVNSGEAVRISTGAVVPAGADTVVRVEDTDELDNSLTVFSVREPGQDIRVKGEEFQAGDLLLERGHQLRTRQLAMLAAVGVSDIPVYTIPRISLLITGTELVKSDDEDIKPFQIRDSNKVMLTSAVKGAGGELVSCDHVGDDLQSTITILERVADQQPDFILCSGGVSVGRHDHVKKSAKQAEFKELFWRIRQKPGKPLFAAKREDTLLFGLPGNPVSAFMCFSHYVRPILSFLQGQPMNHRSITANSPEKIANTGKRANFLRVKVEFTPGAIPRIAEIGKQGSHMLSSITHADGYISLEPGEMLKPGSLKEVFLF